jgi:hypothetical protein
MVMVSRNPKLSQIVSFIPLGRHEKFEFPISKQELAIASF